jgi:hypothetical protein
MIESWFKVLLRAAGDDAATLGQLFVGAIPLTVKTMLGQEEVTIDDLMRLPRVRLDCKDFGCYLLTVTNST